LRKITLDFFEQCRDIRITRSAKGLGGHNYVRMERIMKIDILIQNIFYIFIFSIVLEVAIMAVFSMTALRDVADNRPVKIARDVVVIILAWLICYKSNLLNIFNNTGIGLIGERWYRLDVIISALVMAGFTNVVSIFFERMRR